VAIDDEDGDDGYEGGVGEDGYGGGEDGTSGIHDDVDDGLLADVSLAVRAQRRQLRLDQRALARRAGVAKSTVARIERGDGGVRLWVLRAVLAEVGLDVALVDKDCYPWRDGDALPADVEGAVDRAGRRLPAHLPAALTDELMSWDFCRSGRPLLPAPIRWRYNRFSDQVAALVQEVTEQAPGPAGPRRLTRDRERKGAPD
jgi:transcriptional regulator with XRE-family HTH domain